MNASSTALHVVPISSGFAVHADARSRSAVHGAPAGVGDDFGCFWDEKNNSTRLLPMFLAYNWGNLTQEICAGLARAQGRMHCVTMTHR